MIELQTERMILRTPTLADIESIRDYVDACQYPNWIFRPRHELIYETKQNSAFG